MGVFKRTRHKPRAVLLGMLNKGSAAHRKEVLRLSGLPMPDYFPVVVKGSKAATLRRIAVDKTQPVELRRKTFVELFWGCNIDANPAAAGKPAEPTPRPAIWQRVDGTPVSEEEARRILSRDITEL